MRILMLGNSFTAANNLPRKLAELTGGEVVSHTPGRGAAVGASKSRYQTG